MLTDEEIDIIHKMIARGHVATLGSLDFYCHNEPDDASGDEVLTHQLKGIIQEAKWPKEDGTIKDNMARRLAQSPKVGSFKAIVRSQVQGTKSLGEVVLESLPTKERTPSPLASPEKTKKVQNSLRSAIKKVNAMTNAFKCPRCNSKMCSCPFFKGTVSVSGLHFPKCGLLKKCDSYCIVTYGDTVLHTTRVCNNTYDPVWNEDIEITVQTHDECKELTFDVYSDRETVLGVS
jgi:transcription elongation factor Elf1